jgi:hypothetical protein
MGLDVSHGAFSGSYSSFNRFRWAVCEAMEGKWPFGEDDIWYWGDDYGRNTHPGIYEFLNHSDCDGDIDPVICAKIADELEALLPKIEALGDGGGHIARNGGYGATTQKFISGCREAFISNEKLEFY